MSRTKKIILLTLGVIAGLGLVFGLLVYFQSQGLIKIFPTARDREIKQILKIDRTKFKPAEGLPPEKFEEAIKKLSELRQKVLDNREDAKAWFDFGYAKEFLNDHEGATRAWEKSFALQPLNFMTAGNLANVYQYFLKDYPKAEFYYLKALEVKPDYTSAYQGLSDLYRFNWQEEEDKVEPLLQEALEKDPANQQAYYSILVEFFARKNDFAKAKEYLAKLRQIKPEAANQLVESYPGLR
jgi:tetratricopeptide (TPR) repeat protein